MAAILLLSGAVLVLLAVFVWRTGRGRQTEAGGGKAGGGTPIPRVEPCLPFFGNALHVDTASFHLALSALRQTYGPVYFIKLFAERILVLNDHASIHDALVVKASDFAGRPSMYRTSRADRNKHSIVWQTYTKRLVFLRKSVMKGFRMYGAGLEKLEQRCAPDIRRVCHSFRQTGGEAFDPHSAIYESVCSIMLYLTLGLRFEHGSPVFQAVREMNALFNDTFGSGRGKQLDFVPLLWLFRADRYSCMTRALQLRDQFWHQQLNTMKTSSPDPDCIVQTLLDLLGAGSNGETASSSTSSSSSSTSSSSSSSSSPSGSSPLGPPSPAASSVRDSPQDANQSFLTAQTVKEVFTNLILAGTDTTSTSLNCLLLVLLHQPAVQRGMQQEVDRVVGADCPPSLSHRPHLPYVEAVLMELLRYISHVPLAVPHYTICDTSVLGSPVPADTTVYINLWSLHHDVTEWADPWQFDPSRFLDDGGQLVPPCHQNRRRLLPFGAGRRVCLGEALAKNRLFLFATSLVQQFHFQAEDAENLPDVDPRTYEMGLVIHPKPFRLRAIPRNPAGGVAS